MDKYGIINFVSSSRSVNNTFYIENSMNDTLFKEYIGKSEDENNKIINNIRKVLNENYINNINKIIEIVFEKSRKNTDEIKKHVNIIEGLIKIEERIEKGGGSNSDIELIDTYNKKIRELRFNISNIEHAPLVEILYYLRTDYPVFYNYITYTIHNGDGLYAITNYNLIKYAIAVFDSYKFINVIANKIRQYIDANILNFLDIPFLPFGENKLFHNDKTPLYSYYVSNNNIFKKYYYQISDKQFANSTYYVMGKDNTELVGADLSQSIFNMNLLDYSGNYRKKFGGNNEGNDTLKERKKTLESYINILSFNILKKILGVEYFNYSFIDLNYFNAFRKIINNDIPSIFIPSKELSENNNAISVIDNTIERFSDFTNRPIFELQDAFILRISSYFKYYSVRDWSILYYGSYDSYDNKAKVYDSNELKGDLIHYLEMYTNRSVRNKDIYKYINDYVDTVINILNILLEYKSYVLSYAVSNLPFKVYDVFLDYLKNIQTLGWEDPIPNINEKEFMKMPSGYVSKKNRLRQDMDINSQFLNSDVIISNIRKCIYDR